VSEVEYVEENEWYRDFWAVIDTSIDVPVYTDPKYGTETSNPTIALCDSEAIAKRVAELVNGDAELTALIRQENGVALDTEVEDAS
jgi:hypothetical protein